MTTFAESVRAAVASVVGPGPVGLHEPRFGGNEWRYVKACLDSTFVSSVGAFVDDFEASVASFTGAKHAIAVVNGTAALQIALRLAGVRPCDEVIVPALTFVGTAAAVAHCGATPHFADADERTLGIDPTALGEYLDHAAEVRDGACVNTGTGRVVRALVPMHTFGHPVDIDAVLDVARRFHLQVVEDAAESLGSRVGALHTGRFGALGVLSFNGNKTVTTGGGGAILTDNPALAARAKHLTTTAKLPHRWEYRHDDVGYNFRMPNLNAALGCAQMEQLPALLAAKRRLFERYRDAFAGMPGAAIVAERPGTTSNFWLQTLLLDEEAAGERDAILAATNDAGLMTRPAWTLMHRLAPYAECPRMPLPRAESLERRIVNLPSSAQLAMSAT